MALSDYNWGMIIIGAAAVTALVAVKFADSSLTGGALAALAGSAIAGGGLGQMASNFIGRVQDSAVALVHR